MQAIKDAARKVGSAAVIAAKTPWIVFATLAGVIFLISAISYLVSPFRGTAVVLFYPHAKGNAIESELRYLAAADGDEAKARQLVEELLIGTSESRHLPLVDAETRTQLVMLRGDSLYVDLSIDVLAYREVPFATTEECIRRTVLKNLPFVRQVFITIDGEVLATPEKAPAEAGIEAKTP